MYNENYETDDKSVTHSALFLFAYIQFISIHQFADSCSCVQYNTSTLNWIYFYFFFNIFFSCRCTRLGLFASLSVTCTHTQTRSTGDPNGICNWFGYERWVSESTFVHSLSMNLARFISITCKLCLNWSRFVPCAVRQCKRNARALSLSLAHTRTHLRQSFEWCVHDVHGTRIHMHSLSH